MQNPFAFSVMNEDSERPSELPYFIGALIGNLTGFFQSYVSPSSQAQSSGAYKLLGYIPDIPNVIHYFFTPFRQLVFRCVLSLCMNYFGCIHQLVLSTPNYFQECFCRPLLCGLWPRPDLLVQGNLHQWLPPILRFLFPVAGPFGCHCYPIQGDS